MLLNPCQYSNPKTTYNDCIIISQQTWSLSMTNFALQYSILRVHLNTDVPLLCYQWNSLCEHAVNKYGCVRSFEGQLKVKVQIEYIKLHKIQFSCTYSVLVFTLYRNTLYKDNSFHSVSQIQCVKYRCFDVIEVVS